MQRKMKSQELIIGEACAKFLVVSGNQWGRFLKFPFLFLLVLLTAVGSLSYLSGEEPASEPSPSQEQKSKAQKKPPPPRRKSPAGGDLPITVIARSQEGKDDHVIASGNVEVHYKNLKLFADRIDLNAETKDVFAEGNVVIQLPEEVIKGDTIFFNLDSSRGNIENVFGMMQPNIFYQAESIERKSENVYGFSKAKLTSCTQPTPRWEFSCSRANFKKDDYMEMWDAVLTLKRVPVFYLPYFRYPLDKERSTGFLIPQIGYSGAKGFFYGQSFYWVIARNMDATFNLDYYSARGFGGGLEYRYLLGGGTGGDARLYYFIFNNAAGQEDSSNAYLLRLRHNQPIPAGFRLVANIDYQTSYDFLREFDNNFKRASISNLKSEAYLSRAWSQFNFNLRASRTETYYTKQDSSIITYYLPQLTLSSFKIKLFQPLYFSFNSAFTSWKYGWKKDYDLGKEKYSNSLSFSPVLSLPFSKIPWLTITTSFASSFNYYAQTYAPVSPKTIVDEPLFTFNYNFGLELTGPVFYRVFESSEGTTKVKHIIEPFVTFRYDSPITESDRIITAYGYFRNNQVTYGINNRILVKRDMPREVFTWGIYQSYYLSPEDSRLSIYDWEGEVPSYSDISNYIRFYPARNYSLDVSFAYNIYYDTFSYFRLRGNLNNPADPLFLSVSWFKSMNPWYRDVLGNRHQIGFNGGFKIPRLSLEMMGDFDYNILEGRMLYAGVSLVYHYQCLDFKADFRIFYYRAEPETQFRISVGLGNIGKTTDFLGGLGF